jgi:hypothetical protein
VSLAELAEIERRLALRMIAVFGLDASAVALDMTNFATYIDSTNTRADIAQRGKAKQKRSDLRLVGLGLVVTRDGGVPLLSHAYPGNKPDVTQFPTMLADLAARHQAVAGPTGAASQMTVVFDAGQNSKDNFALLDGSGLHFVGSVPPSDCPELLALPAADRHAVDPDRHPGLTAIDTRRTVFGKQRRVVLTLCRARTRRTFCELGFWRCVPWSCGGNSDAVPGHGRGLWVAGVARARRCGQDRGVAGSSSRGREVASSGR